MRKFQSPSITLISLGLICCIIFSRCTSQDTDSLGGGCRKTITSLTLDFSFTNINSQYGFPNFGNLASSSYSNFVSDPNQLITNGYVYFVLTVHVLDDSGNDLGPFLVTPIMNEESNLKEITPDGKLVVYIDLTPTYPSGTNNPFTIYVDGVDIIAVDVNGNDYEWTNNTNNFLNGQVYLTSTAISTGNSAVTGANYSIFGYSPITTSVCYGFDGSTFALSPLGINVAQLIQVTNDSKLLQIKAARTKKQG
jgi:hypothetical protein